MEKIKIGRFLVLGICTIPFLILCSFSAFSQYLIQGSVDKEHNYGFANLDMLDNWEDMNSVSDRMTVKSVEINEDGSYKINGNELPEEDGIYRIRYSSYEGEVSIEMVDPNYINFCFANDDTIKIVNNNFIPNNAHNKRLARIIELHRDFMRQSIQAENEINEGLVNTKYLMKCKEIIKESDDALCNMFCLQSSNIFIEESPELFKKVQFELKDEKIRACYYNSLSPVIQSYEYQGLERSKNKLRVGLIVSGLFNLILLGLFLGNRRKNKEEKVTPKLDNRLESLTNKESEILELIISKKSNKEIAASCFISDTTVKTHINNIYRKLQVKSRKEVTDLYLQHKSTRV